MAKAATALHTPAAASAKTAKIFKFPVSKGAVTPAYRALIERHRTARSAYVKSYWATVDHPAADRVMLQVDELNKFAMAHYDGSLNVFTWRDQLRTAIRRYIAHCRKTGSFAYRSPEHKPEIAFTPETLAYYKKHCVANYYRSWDDRVFFKKNAEDASGHTRAKEEFVQASAAQGEALKALRDYIAEQATVREIGLFANYTVAYYRNDFDAHLEELGARRAKGAKGLPSTDDLCVQADCDMPFNLEAISRGLRRLSV